LGDLDRLDLTRLPRAPSAAEDGQWRDAAGKEGETEPTPSEPLQPEALTGGHVVPVARPKRSEEMARTERGQQPRGSLPEKAPTPRPAIATSDQIAAAQRKLIALDYDVGQADGRSGPRTETAVREFQTMQRLDGDGRIDDRLLAQLDAELRHREARRQQELAATAPPPRKSELTHRRGMFGSMMGGLQRLIGREFDSFRRPGEIAAYCRASPDNWIYDFGREAFVYCGNVNASGVTAIASGRPAEAAGP
jgi:peptidoglycan hydrolase-like protein with peptidoglycan-binding domain